MSLQEKTAIVLGASAEGGTGWAVAERLAAEGAHVVAAARNLDELNRLAARTGGKAFRCDAAVAADIAALTAFTKAQYGKVDIAVNAAGLPMPGAIADAKADDIQRALDVNYIANAHFIKEAAAVMNDGGAITVISSYSAVQPVMPHFAYACAKAATDCLVRYAALEFGPRRIRVNSILPGPIKSDLARDLLAVPGVEETFAREIPLGRIGLPADYADAIVWLAEAAFVTGLNIPLNGGNHLTRMPRPDELPLGEKSFDGDYA